MAKVLKICMGSSCFCRGNEENLALIEEFIAENNLDTEIRLTGTRCEQLCDKGPIIYIDNILYEKVDRGVLLDVLNKEFPGN